VAAASNGDFSAVASPGCVVNLGIPVELGGSLQQSRSDDVWSTTGGVKAKLVILPGETVSVGVIGQTSFVFSGGPNPNGTVYFPLTFHPVETLKLNFNGGIAYDAGVNRTFASWGAGFEWQFVKRFTLIGEVFGLGGERVPGSAVTEPRAQLGIRFTPQEWVDIDVIYGRNITGEDANWITVGLNLRFTP
jgi:hypothetical protein